MLLISCMVKSGLVVKFYAFLIVVVLFVYVFFVECLYNWVFQCEKASFLSCMT